MNTQSGPHLLAVPARNPICHMVAGSCRSPGRVLERLVCVCVYAIADYILSDSSSRYIQLYPAHVEATLTDFHELDPCVRFTGHYDI